MEMDLEREMLFSARRFHRTIFMGRKNAGRTRDESSGR
jgi:hypothetical protein